MALNDIYSAANTFTWQPGDVILDLYEVLPVIEGFGDSAVEKSCHQGGFGQVNRVHHRGWNIELAVKTPRPEVFENEAQVEDFTCECETWLELGLHPHIVTCYYVRNLSGQPLVFAEYVAGGSLKDWVASGLLYEGGHEAALKKILDIAIQAAWGLHYAHEQGLVHQDVKPANIMLTPEGQAKVCDFGIARARAKGVSTNTKLGTVLVSRGGMTQAYCSPEQALGEQLTRRTDIWSWGLTVLEMFTGEATWSSGVAASQALDAYLEHCDENAEIPPMVSELVHLLKRCFQSEEQNRPRNFSEIAEELRGIYHTYCGEVYFRYLPKAATDSADSLNNRALSLYDLGHQGEAEKLWKEALRHDPAHLASTYNLGLIDWRSGIINDDVLILKLEALRKGQPNSRVRYLLALVHAERYDYQEAVTLLEQAFADGNMDIEVEALLNKLKPLECEGARCLRTFKGHTHSVNSVCLSADDRYALSGGGDETLKLWDVASFKPEVTNQRFIAQLEVSYATNTGDALSNEVEFNELMTTAQKALSTGESEHALLTLLKARALPSRLRDRQLLNLWFELYPHFCNIELLEAWCLSTFEGHTDRVTSVCLSADGRYALSGSGDKTLKLWDVATGVCLHTRDGHAEAVTSGCLSADGLFSLSGSLDETLKLWDVATGRCLRTFDGHGNPVSSNCLSADNRFALSASMDEIILWNVATGDCLRTFEGHTHWVNSVCLSADSRYVLSGSRDYTLKLWDLATGECLHTFEEYPFEEFPYCVTSVCLSADGHYAISGSSDKMIKLWGVESGKCLRTFAGHTGSVNSVCISADGRHALSGSEDKTLKLWDVATGECLHTFEGHTDSVNSVCLSADGRYAVSGSSDGAIKLWVLYWGLN